MKPVVLKHFESEVEARVAESFLRSQGYDVKLLDTFSPTHHRYRDGKRGLRLLVRADEVDKIRELLEERLRSAHLQVLEPDHDPKAPTAFVRFVVRLKNFFGI